ncbi:flp pilus-assembly TadE/G-like family protein [Spongiactinospora gelatinilytica]|nr:flp pilus-assembly TadE/G-like family protein [Spongiactinospora gelatinilytica]
MRRAVAARIRRDRGSMSIFVVVFSVVVFLLAGMLVDGGAAINARLRANDVAEQAARAGADVIDDDHLRTTGQARLLDDEGAVCAEADEIVTAHGDDAMRRTRCELAGDLTTVTVGVSVRWDAFFLSAIGFPGMEMEGSATAGPETGEGTVPVPSEPSEIPTEMPVSGLPDR